MLDLARFQTLQIQRSCAGQRSDLLSSRSNRPLRGCPWAKYATTKSLVSEGTYGLGSGHEDVFENMVPRDFRKLGIVKRLSGSTWRF